MKKISAFLLTLMFILGVGRAFPVNASEQSCKVGQIEELDGTVWQDGDVIRTEDCAVMLCYWFENEDGTQEGMDALCDSIDSYLKSKGYGGTDASSRIYFIRKTEDTQWVSVLAIGEDLEFGVEAGGTRRFAHHNEIWASQDGAEGWQVISCEEQDYYEKAEETYPCFYIELMPFFEEEEPEKNTADISVQTAGCRHLYEYVIVKEPTEKEDGLVAKQCEKCGTVAEYQPISALGAFLKNTEKAVKEAAEGAAVTVNTDRWLCFDRAVMEAIASRPDAAVTVNYRYQNKDYTVLIPAGYDVVGLLNEEGYCGFRYLDLILGGSEVKK